VVAHTGNHSTQEAEAGELQVPEQSGQHNKTLSQKKKTSIFVLKLLNALLLPN
jgi:hypothetical protein